MIEVRTDAQKKRIYLTIAGVNDVKTANDGAAKMLAAARSLGAGFDLVNDISTMKIVSEEVGAVIMKAQAELGKLGPRRVVRVVGSAAMAAMQMSRTGREAGATYGVQTVATVAEAEAALAKG
jgi:hypothetical protein